MITAMYGHLGLENAKLGMKLDTSSKTQAETKVVLTEDLGEARNDLWKKTKEFDELRRKIGKIEKQLANLLGAYNGNKEKIQGLKSQIALYSNAIAHFSVLVRYHLSNCLFVTALNDESRKRVNSMEGKFLEAELCAKQPQAKVISMTE